MNKRDQWNQRYDKNRDLFGTDVNIFLKIQLTRAECQLSPGAKILSLADGEGINSLWLTQQGFTVTSIDSASSACEIAKSNADKAGVNYEIIFADLQQQNIGTEKYDMVNWFFLHLPPKERSELLNKTVASLKPGGLFLLEAFHPDHLLLKKHGPKSENMYFNESFFHEWSVDFETIHLKKTQGHMFEASSGKQLSVTLQYAGLKK